MLLLSTIKMDDLINMRIQQLVRQQRNLHPELSARVHQRNLQRNLHPELLARVEARNDAAALEKVRKKFDVGGTLLNKVLKAASTNIEKQT